MSTPIEPNDSIAILCPAKIASNNIQYFKKNTNNNSFRCQNLFISSTGFKVNINNEKT